MPLLRLAQPSPTGGLLTHEAVLGRDAVVGEVFFVKQVAVLLLEIVVGVVARHDLAILDLEGIAEIIVEVVAADLDIPAGEVFAVEKLLPLLLVRVGFFLCRRGAGSEG